MRKKFGIRTKVLLISSLANLIFTVGYTVYSYRVQKAEIIEGINGKLNAAARALPMLVPDGFHDQVTGADSVDHETYSTVMEHLSAYSESIGITYLYSYVEMDGKFYVASTNATEEEMAEGTETQFFQLYERPPASMMNAWATRDATFDEYEDEWGSFRSIFVPAMTESGRQFVVGADVSTDFIQMTLAKTLMVCIGFGMGAFLVLWAVASLLLNRILRPIGSLSAVIRKTVEQNFALKDEQRLELEAVSNRHEDEVGHLSSAFLDMDSRLQKYITDLRETTAAKERVEGELKIAWEIQQNFLPQVLPGGVTAENFDLHAFLTPAKAVGGDLYDFYLMRDNKLCFAIGDVSDKGVPAAMTMAVTLTLFRSLGQRFLACEELMTELNNALCRHVSTGQFVTMLAGVIDAETGEVVYSHAGHNQPYIVRPSTGEVTMLSPDIRPFLGAMDDIDYVANTITLEPGDYLFLYTDGITEAFCEDGTYYGDDRLKDFLKTIATEAFSAEDIVKAVIADVESFTNGFTQSDDIAALAVRFNPVASRTRVVSSEDTIAIVS
ncbi:MAG: SpoIIE family protein phosphatase [Verrucomicrobiales bacterium]